jgi:HAD superfamily hydrolase (TIGR01509 family)
VSGGPDRSGTTGGEAWQRLPAAVLFDLDGTLIDTEPCWMAEEQALAQAFGGSWTSEQAVSCIGNPLPVSAARLRAEAGVDLQVAEIVDRLLDGVVATVRRHVPWQPGARELLAALRRASTPLALVTMSYRRLADAVLSDLPDNTFAVVVTGDQVTHGKPHPEPYLTAAAALGVDPGACLVVEDSPSGIGSGLAAGATVVAVPHVAPLPDLPEVTVVPTLADLDPHRLPEVTRARV